MNTLNSWCIKSQFQEGTGQITLQSKPKPKQMAHLYLANARTCRSPVVTGFGLNTRDLRVGKLECRPGNQGSWALCSISTPSQRTACSSSQALLQDVLKRYMLRENRGQADHILQEWLLNYQFTWKRVKDADSWTPPPTLHSHPWNPLFQQADQVIFRLTEIWGPLLASVLTGELETSIIWETVRTADSQAPS